ncbi:hypothetical protein NHG34_08295 [Aerococcaceae bacterium NML190938]|nr:hypothetical protein [Aerococcaceae bacterium NML190938]
MKKRLLALLATLTLTSIPLSVFAQESSSSMSESIVTNELNDYAGLTSEFLEELQEMILTPKATYVNGDVLKNYLIAVKKYELADVDALLASLDDEKGAGTIANAVMQSGDKKEKLSEMTFEYLKNILKIFDQSEDILDEYVETTWKFIQCVENYGFIKFAENYSDADEKTFDDLKVEFAKYEYKRLVLSNFNEDGSFKDKLYSKHMLELHHFLKDKEADFVKEYKVQQDKILEEIEARKTASDAVKKIEEKRAKGETISEEEIKKVEAAVAKVQTQSHREVAQTTKESVVTSQTNNIPYDKPAEKAQPQSSSSSKKQSESVVSSPKPQQVAEQPEPVAPAPAPEPEPTSPPAPEVYQIPAGFFASFEEADAYGYSVLDGLNVGSFQTYTAGFLPDGTPYYGVDLLPPDVLN